MPYPLHEHPVALLAPNNHPRVKCEKTQFESIQDEDVPYSVTVENITAEGTGDIFKAFALHFLCAYIYIIYIYITYSILSIQKARNNIFLLIQKHPLEVFCEKRCS